MARRDRLIRQVLRERFIVTMRGGESFDGLLIGADEKTIHLADGFALEGKNRLPVDGALYLPRSEVAYMQKPGEVRG